LGIRYNRYTLISEITQLIIEREVDGNPLYYDIKNFIKNQTYPMGASKINKKTLRSLAMDFYLDGETLYKKSSDETLLRCFDVWRQKVVKNLWKEI